MNIVPLFSFLAGIVSVLSPCVLPVIPILIGYSLKNRNKTEILAFITGLFLIFIITISLTIIFTAAINYYLHYFRIIAALVIIALGLMILTNKSIFNFSINSFSNKSSHDPHSNKGIIGSFTWGVVTSLAWAPCYGSYLIALITYSVSTGNTFYSAINLILYTTGFAISLFILGLFISTLNIEKLVGKADLIQKLSGILITGAGIYMLFLIFGY